MWSRRFSRAVASWDVPGQRGGPADDWRGGGDAVGTAVSSFDVVDRIMEMLSDVRLYPALKRVVLVGFSAGGQFTGRYVATGKCPLRKELAVDFAVIAPSTELRLDPDTTWHYGLKDRPRYSAKLTEADIRRNLASRRVWRGCGTKDVTNGSLDVSPPAMQQGKNRYDRFTNFKEYLKGYPDWAAKRRCRSTTSPASATAGRCSETLRCSTSSPVRVNEIAPPGLSRALTPMAGIAILPAYEKASHFRAPTGGCARGGVVRQSR